MSLNGAPALNNTTILAVDDDPVMLMLATEFFSDEGCRVVTASSGRDALSRIREIAPNMVLLDISMPDMDGYEVCSQIKAIPEFEHIPIIMLSGLDENASIARAYETGACDFSTKPVNWMILKHRVSNAMRASTAFVNENRAARLSKTIEKSPNEVFVLDLQANSILKANPSALQNLGYSQEELRAKHIWDIAQLAPGYALPELIRSLTKSQQTDVNLSLKRKNGTSYPVSGVIFSANDSKPNVLIGMFQDNSEKVQAQAELHRLAYYDELTGLPNRRWAAQHIDEYLSAAQQAGARCAVCLLDLDDFKSINVSLGYSAGDSFLKTLSQRLCATLRQYDIAAREWNSNSIGTGTEVVHLGGDEFLILLRDITDTNEVASLASRVLQMLSAPIHINKQQLTLTASLGISVFPEDGSSHDDLLMHADSAMYEVKHQGKNNYAFYTPKTGARIASRLQLENDLRAAIKNNELELHYQPQVDSSLQRIVGAEAMLRWRHPLHGLRYPDLFVHLLEDTGLILPVGEWVLQQALAQLNAWSGVFAEDFTLSVNVSGVQVRHPGFAEFTQELLQTHEAVCAKLVLELTESALLSSTQEVKNVLRDIKATGAKIAIDDFGTGYSALSYLRDFPIDSLKVDRSFVTDLETNRDSKAIVMAIFNIAKALNLDVTVEGVQNLEQLEITRQMGECLVQGWLVSPAVPANEFEKFAHSFNAQTVNQPKRNEFRPQIV